MRPFALSDAFGSAGTASPIVRAGTSRGSVYDGSMRAATDLDALRGSLARGADPVPPPDARLAGVLVPILGGDDPSAIFTRRTENLSRHAGEISFPGGLRHDEDDDLRATALRESEEELGIEPSLVEVLGSLPPVHTFVSGILIAPFVGALRERPSLVPNEAEIDEVLEFRLSELDRAEAIVEFPRDGHVYRGFAYEMPGATIWGATARILHDLLEITRAAGRESA
jgi:8-oxo-dGTP pyrophosphatase MutT (NUDIX family)